MIAHRPPITLATVQPTWKKSTAPALVVIYFRVCRRNCYCENRKLVIDLDRNGLAVGNSHLSGNGLTVGNSHLSGNGLAVGNSHLSGNGLAVRNSHLSGNGLAVRNSQLAGNGLSTEQ